ncbi:hypothetical protein ABPG75_002705 [Micractinium tetrahymenae]
MPADAARGLADAAKALPPPAEQPPSGPGHSNGATPAAASFAASTYTTADFEQDREYYAGLPLGLLHPAVLDHGAAAGCPATAGRRRYLCYFLHRHLEFRLPDAQSAAEVALEGGHAARLDTGCRGGGGGGAAVVWEKPFGNRPESPFWYAHVHSKDAAKAIAARSLLTKVVLEVWGEGETLEGLQAAVAAHPEAERAKWGGAEQSFKFVVDTWGCTFTMAQQVELIESMEGCTRFQGRIDLRSPQNRFWLIVVKSNGRGLPLLPDRYYFGREVAAGDRSVVSTYDLRRRRYLGPTSMDTEMAFLMCNICKARFCSARVRRCSLVLDPFVGTGSILIPAAHLGALTLGADIDIRVIKLGKKDKAGRQVNVWTNFRDYGLPPPLGLLRCDLHTAPFRDGLEEVLDAIVCDPPYGVRAGGKKSVAKERLITDRTSYIPSTDPYTLAECLHDLLDAAARLLRVGGRLAYFMPSAPGFYCEDEVPRHPALEMLANCEQMLTTRYSRRLILMEKVKTYSAAEAAAYFERRGPPRMSIDNMHEYIYKSPAELAAEAGVTLEEHRAAQAARIPRHRGKNI